MTLKQYKAPTGSPIVGTLEKVPARANITGINDDGTPEYEGGSDVFWDDMETQTREGKIIFLDDDGEEWTFDQLTVDEDSDDNEAEG